MREVEAEGDDADLVGARDAEAHQVLLHRLGHRHERVGGGGEARLQPAEEGRLRGREVPAQHVAVEGVNHGGNARRPRGEPADEPRLGGVRVDDVRPPRAHEAVKPHERAQVRKRRDLATEPGHRLTSHVLLRREREHVALARRLRSHDQPRLVAQGTKTGAQEDHVNRRTPDVQAGEDPQNAQPSSRFGA